jgi:hypothetical protein
VLGDRRPLRARIAERPSLHALRDLVDLGVGELVPAHESEFLGGCDVPRDGVAIGSRFARNLPLAVTGCMTKRKSAIKWRHEAANWQIFARHALAVPLPTSREQLLYEEAQFSHAKVWRHRSHSAHHPEHVTWSTATFGIRPANRTSRNAIA